MTQNFLCEDVENVVKSFISNNLRLRNLRNKYSNRFLTSGLERKNHYQLELIHSKLIDMIYFKEGQSNDSISDKLCKKCDFYDVRYLFYSLEVKHISAMKNRPEGVNFNPYMHNWYMWNIKWKKEEKIQKIINIIQRMCDIADCKKIDSPNKKRLRVIRRSLNKQYCETMSEKVIKVLSLMATILNKPVSVNQNKKSK